MYCHDKAYLSKREHNARLRQPDGGNGEIQRVEEREETIAKRIIYTCLYHLCILFK